MNRKQPFFLSVKNIGIIQRIFFFFTNKEPFVQWKSLLLTSGSPLMMSLVLLCGPECISVPSASNDHPLIVSTAKHRKSRSARLCSQSQCLYFPLLLLTTGISCTGGLVCLHLKYSAEISWSRAVEDIHTHAPLWQWATLSMPSYGRTFQHEA